MGGRRDSALVAANIADRIRVIGVDVCGLVLDAFFPIRAISIRAFVPVARAVLAPITIAVLMGGRCDGALVAANIADRIRVIVIDVRGLVRDALVPIRAVSIRAFVPVARAVLAPVAIAVLMGGRRDGAFVAADVAGRICIIVVMCGFILDAARLIRAVCGGALVPVVCLVLAPVAVGVLMGRRGHGAFVAAGVAGRIRGIVVDMVFRVLDAARLIRAICFRALVPVVCLVLAPVAVGMLVCRRSHGAHIVTDIAGCICIVVIAVCLRLPALVGIGAVFSGADTVVSGFAVGSPVAVGMLMLCAEAPIGADVAEFILIVIIDVGRAVHFFAPIRAVFGGADAIVPFGIIAPAVKGVRMAEFGGANITAVVAVWIRVIIIAVGGFVLDAAGLIRAVCIGTLVPVAVYVPAPIAVDMTAGMVRGSGTLVFADIAGGVRVVVIDVGIPVDDPAVLLRAVRIGAFAPMLPAVPAPLAIEMGMSRGDGTVVAADAANVAAVGVAGLSGLGLAAGFGAGLPVFGTVIVPFPVGVLGMPVAADGAVAVAVEGMGRFVLLRAGSVCADRVGTLAPVAGLIPTVKAFRVGVAADGAGIAAGDAFRAGLAVVNMLGIVGNKFAIA